VRRAAAFVLAGAFLAAAAGCGGGGGDPHPALAQTAAKLGAIRSGNLSLSLHVQPHGNGDEFGFEVKGPFSLAKSGSLPVADLEYTQIANGQQATARLISTGRNAYVQVGDTAYELPTAQTASLRGATGDLRSGGGLAQLRIDDWIEDPHLSDGGSVGGADTDHVHAGLNTAAAVNDLLALARGFGNSLPTLDAKSRKRLVAATKSASLDLWTGKKDRLLRKLDIAADFGLSVPDALASALGTTVGAKVSFDLGIVDPNSPVNVSSPAHALPASQFPG
jgi:hypothetical protein